MRHTFMRTSCLLRTLTLTRLCNMGGDKIKYECCDWIWQWMGKLGEIHNSLPSPGLKSFHSTWPDNKQQLSTKCLSSVERRTKASYGKEGKKNIWYWKSVPLIIAQVCQWFVMPVIKAADVSPEHPGVEAEGGSSSEACHSASKPFSLIVFFFSVAGISRIQPASVSPGTNRLLMCWSSGK